MLVALTRPPSTGTSLAAVVRAPTMTRPSGAPARMRPATTATAACFRRRTYAVQTQTLQEISYSSFCAPRTRTRCSAFKTCQLMRDAWPRWPLLACVTGTGGGTVQRWMGHCTPQARMPVHFRTPARLGTFQEPICSAAARTAARPCKGGSSPSSSWAQSLVSQAFAAASAASFAAPLAA